MELFKGSGVAIVTPFNKDESIDYETLKKLIDFQIENKTDAIIICGTTGESATLSYEEHGYRHQRYRYVKEEVWYGLWLR